MSVETDLYDALTADSGVMAHVRIAGASPDEGRIYPDVIPDDASVPAIAFQRINTDYDQTIHAAGPLGRVATIEVACVANSRTTADALADAVESAAFNAGFHLDGRGAQEDLDAELWATTILVSKDSTS